MRPMYAASVLGLAMIVGCTTTPYQAAEKTNNNLSGVKTELLTDKGALHQAVDDLNDLIYHPQSDLRPQYKKFADSVDALDTSTAASRASAKSMVASRETYMSKWRADAAAMTDADLRMRALNRINDTEKEFVMLGDKLLDVDNTVSPQVNDLKSVRMYLQGDLTANGIKMISDRASDAKTKADMVYSKIDDAVTQIDKVSAEIAPMPASTEPTTMSSTMSSGM